MGQYYKPILLDDQNNVIGWFHAHDIQFNFVRDDGKTIKISNGLKLMEHSYIGNDFVSEVERFLINSPCRLVWAGDYADVEKTNNENLFSIADETQHTKFTKKKVGRPLGKKYRYLVNHTKGEFVDKKKVPSKEGWKVHPLPLLTCEGNGKGSGDYHLENSYIGTWARDEISVETSKPKGYKEIKPNFEDF